ncbi:unnamed protein product [Paramecium pentaurelia]|uniref:Uncharacterized protein n=1 Tax=Paramecium pentaurelia TaxID=43138 RepID=A0A8S1VV97_9CILI|nr:unnamed protein product [Paramecium pentaurelia]
MELNAQVIQLDQIIKNQEITIIDYRNENENLQSLHMECLETTEELSHELNQNINIEILWKNLIKCHQKKNKQLQLEQVNIKN